MTANESFIDFEPTVLNKSTSFNKYLDRNFTLNTLIAFNYMIECLKSVILGVALLERRISSVDECLNLTLLEHSHQYEQWGKVEWYHDINEQVGYIIFNKYIIPKNRIFIKLEFQNCKFRLNEFMISFVKK